MHIVVLDEVELSDRQYRRLASLGSVDVQHDSPVDGGEAVRRLAQADIAVVGWTQLGAAELAQLPRLRLISVWATGFDYVDTTFARERAITVTNVPSYAERAVAELTIGLLLTLARKIVPADLSVRRGSYEWRGFQGFELPGKTLGLIGVGSIGREVSRLAKAFDVRVLAHSPNLTPARAATLGVDCVSLHELLSSSDVVSLHVPLTAGTRQLIGRDEIALMRPTGFIINTSRAAVTDQSALVDALAQGRIAGAALDDIDFPDERLTRLPNVVLTPHIGFYTDRAITRKGDVCISNIAAYLAGTPDNVVN
ncbi:hypothetical protein MXD61_10975 [Frankia sp. AgPm24]|uniref:2-hydroxyacid dehydrogenase n=1 Tax=Frankia sp. AgPm24 TaxID=631128 RepID=UPI00200E197E|nr:NAD(P)-dependent oxidoreductase [Frankia sp. AgPm24]MCK9922393.1 hypothetical protein [Frankia sp. AgPm24]